MRAPLTYEDICRFQSAIPERPDLDFKIDVPREGLAKHVCAMANTEGGHIILGLGDKPDPATGKRKIQGIALDFRIEAACKSGRDSVWPHVVPEPDYYPLAAADGQSVVVITVQKPADNKLRFYKHVAYKRVPGVTEPQTVPMTEDEINAFYISRMKEWAEQCARDTQTLVETALGELALRIHRTRRTEIEEDTLYPIIKDLAIPELEQGLGLVLKTHHVLQFHGTRVSFISPQTLTFYAATGLKAKGIEEVSQYMEDERWDDVLLGVAGLASSQHLDYLVEQAITRDRPLFAIECFLSRSPGLAALTRTRSRVLNLLERTFRTHPDRCMQVLCFRELGGRVLCDSDAYFRSEVLRITATVPPPSRVLRSLYRRLVPDLEEDPRIRAQIANILADAKASNKDKPEMVKVLVDALDKHNQHRGDERDLAPVRDAILVALAAHLSGPQIDKEAEVIRVAISKTRDDYKSSEEEEDARSKRKRKPVKLPLKLQGAINRLVRFLGSEAGAPAGASPCPR